jgi:hypothetical protein
MASYQISWAIDVECEGGHKAAAQLVADRYFAAHIAAGEPGSACSFVVMCESDKAAVNIDLADSLSDLEGDDTL